VGADQGPEQGQHLARVVVAVAETVDPQILVVGDERWLVVGQDPAVPTREDDLGIEEVAQDLDGRPLSGRRSAPQTIARLCHQSLGLVREPRHDLCGVAVAEHPEEHLLVLARPIHRVDVSVQGDIGLDPFRVCHAPDSRTALT
jgi:hypothetical protein